MCVVEADETPAVWAARRSTGDEGERSIAVDDAAVGDGAKVCCCSFLGQTGKAERGSGDCRESGMCFCGLGWGCAGGL